MKENRTNYSVNYLVTSPSRGQWGSPPKMVPPMPPLDTPTKYAWIGARREETREVSTRMLSSGYGSLSLVGSTPFSIVIGPCLVHGRSEDFYYYFIHFCGRTRGSWINQNIFLLFLNAYYRYVYSNHNIILSKHKIISFTNFDFLNQISISILKINKHVSKILSAKAQKSRFWKDIEARFLVLVKEA